MNNVKERPILFSGEMVRAILDGRKTMTRRVIKAQPPKECSIHYMIGDESWLPEGKRSSLSHHWEAWSGELYKNRPQGHLCGTHAVKCPYGQPGDKDWRTGPMPGPGWYYVKDLLPESLGGDDRAVWVWPEYETWGWSEYDDPESIYLETEITVGNIQWKRPGDRLYVREAWRADSQCDGVKPRELSLGEPVLYEADQMVQTIGCMMIEPGRYRHARFMPHWASRILLEVVSVRVERLQDISNEESLKEGVGHLHGYDESKGVPRDGRLRFAELWQSINGAGSWDANPWVWVIEFKRIEP